MKATAIQEKASAEYSLSATIRALVGSGDYAACEDLISKAMGANPHSPEPHNLMGILLEKTGNHPMAMKHFRAACDLDPTYRPASQNINNYGTFYSSGRCAFDDTDCMDEGAGQYVVQYNEQGIGHVVGRR